jgi:hypothetical protein
MMTMLSDSMITWLTPTIRPVLAEGTMTFQVICRRVAADHAPRSSISGGTERSASTVMRAIGGMA